MAGTTEEAAALDGPERQELVGAVRAGVPPEVPSSRGSALSLHVAGTGIPPSPGTATRKGSASAANLRAKAPFPAGPRS